MKHKKVLALILAVAVTCGAFALLSGCAKTPAPEEAAESAAEQTQAPEAQTPDEDEIRFEYVFDKGVWAASISEEVDTYFIFYDQQSGRTERADGTGGVPFTCEQNGLDIVFHFGSEDDVTHATFSEGDATGTFEYGDSTVVYTFEYVADADADTFEVPVQ